MCVSTCVCVRLCVLPVGSQTQLPGLLHLLQALDWRDCSDTSVPGHAPLQSACHNHTTHAHTCMFSQAYTRLHAGPNEHQGAPRRTLLTAQVYYMGIQVCTKYQTHRHVLLAPYSVLPHHAHEAAHQPWRLSCCVLHIAVSVHQAAQQPHDVHAPLAACAHKGLNVCKATLSHYLSTQRTTQGKALYTQGGGPYSP